MLLLALACAPHDPHDDTAAVTAVPPAPYGPGLGPHAVESETTSVAGSDVTWYRPADGEGWPVVVWSHGFARTADHHATAASRAASWGYLVAVPALPSFSDHAANAAYVAEDLVPEALARPEAGEQVALVGHSAGGLVSVLAAAQLGPDALVGLDAVDADGLGEAAAPEVTAPALLLSGEPGDCNADGNDAAWALGGETWRVHVTDATHCDFESDTDGLCEGLCGAADPDRQALVQTYAVAWLEHVVRGGAEVWIQGSEAEADRDAGRIDW